jgi:hypothetical protein
MLRQRKSQQIWSYAALAGVAAMAMLAPAPGHAQGLPITIDFEGNTLTTSTDLSTLLSDLLSQQLPANPNITITLNVDLPAGFPLTSSSCEDGVSLVRLGNGQYGVRVDANLNVDQVLGCTLDTLNALQSTLGTIAPLLARQNDFLMSLDIGLDRQIDLLTSSEGGDGDPIWQQPFGLGGSAGLGPMSEPWAGSRLGAPADGQPSSFAFATSLSQARQAFPPPYALGAKETRVAPAKPKFDVWAEGYFAHFDDSVGGIGSDGHTGVLYLGADYMLAPQLLVGALVQFDDTQQDFDLPSRSASTTGWMAGPYAALRLPYNLFFQARAAWGQSDNEVSLGAGPEDHFDSDRWLVRGTLLGERHWGQWRLQPRASVGYIEDEQESFTSSVAGFVPSQTVSLGQAKAGSQLAYREKLAGGMVIEPSLLLEGIWNFHQDIGAISIDDLVTTDEPRGRAEAGVMLYALDGMSLGASVSYDGIGSSDYEAIGGRVRARMPLN